MNKFLMASLIAGVLLFMPAAEAEIKTYTGEATATAGDSEPQDKVIERAKNNAIRDAREKAGVYIKSESRSVNFELADDEVVTISSGIVRLVDKHIEKSLINNDILQVRYMVTVEIDTDELQREIERIRDTHTIGRPPIDRPQPILKDDDTKGKDHKDEELKVEPPPPPPPPTPDNNLKETNESPGIKIESLDRDNPLDEAAATQELFNLINAERAKAGKPALTKDFNLAKGAKGRAKELTQKWSNKRPDGSGWWMILPPAYQQKSMWEYIHSDYDTPQKIIDWYSSQADSKILSGNYKTIGIGYFYKADSDDKHYWVVILA